MRNISKIKLLLIGLGTAILFTGCEPTYVYIYPKYPTIKNIKKIPSVKFIVEKDGRLSSGSTTRVFKTMKALRKKESYNDRSINKWNKQARAQNIFADKNNPKVKPEDNPKDKQGFTINNLFATKSQLSQPKDK